MTERPGPTPEGIQPTDPVQREMDQIDQRLASPRKLPRTALERSLDRIGRIGMQKWSSPGELYANLAGISSRIAQAAAERGQTADAAAFIERQEGYMGAVEQLSLQPEGVPTLSRPSQPRRTTGKSAG